MERQNEALQQGIEKHTEKGSHGIKTTMQQLRETSDGQSHSRPNRAGSKEIQPDTRHKYNHRHIPRGMGANHHLGEIIRIMALNVNGLRKPNKVLALGKYLANLTP